MIFLLVLASLNVVAWGGLAIIFFELAKRAAERTDTALNAGVLVLALPAVLAILIVCLCWHVRKREPLFSAFWAIGLFVMICILFLLVPVLAISGGGV